LIGKRRVNTANSLHIEPISLHAASTKELNSRSIVSSGLHRQRPIIYRRIDPLISASRGTLAGDLLWLGAIGFILAIITGMIG
jgi:hypothetical protein